MKYIVCIKNIEMKLYLPSKKWTMNETLIFFKIVPSVFNTSIPAVKFPLVEIYFCFVVIVI